VETKNTNSYETVKFMSEKPDILTLCINRGDPDPKYNDVCFLPSLGNVRNDMGAHGGPGACGWEYYSRVVE